MKSIQYYCLVTSLSFFWFLCSCNQQPELRMGDQVWMTRNYDGLHFRNGDLIPEAKSIEEWEKAGINGSPAWCYYNNDSMKGKKYGRIYNWYAIIDPRGFSPDGWHVPTNEEWINLETYLGENSKPAFLFGGYRSKEGHFSGTEEFTYLFSSTERDPTTNDIWGRGIHRNNATMMKCGMYKGHGLYVRLIKN